jgi:tetratricopeptide (TPR) repeat protein
MIDVHDGSQLWGDQFNATAASLSSLQSQISDALTTQLRQGISREQRRIVANRYTADAQAYDHYLWGLHALNTRDLPNALNWFHDAVARDPQFAAAYAGLATTYGIMNGYGRIPPDEGTNKVLSFARKALELDPNNAEALVSIATTKYRNLWDFAGADADYRHALALNPNYATGHEWYADYLRSMGRWSESRREMEIAHKLDPLSPPINIMMCFQLYYERRYVDAIAFARAIKARIPECSSPTCVANSMMALGDIDGAMKELNAPLSYPREPRKFFLTAAEWLQKNQQTAETPVMIAAMYARAGKPDDAFAWLEKAYQRRVGMLTNVNIDPAFESLHGDPRYDNLLRRIGLPRVEAPCNPNCDGASK